jgi:arsenite methyltransferase
MGSKTVETPERILGAVRARYGSVARSGLSSEQGGVRAVAEAFGYTPEELSSIPAEANMGLSCGNPVALANLREGEVVVDLGSGGGLDVFLAASKVGPRGRAVGIDMTTEMIELARRNAARLEGGAHANVAFRQATIDRLPLEDGSVDCVISNCVINLAPDKPAVFREIARVLKPGGRLAVSDIALKRELPPQVASDVTAYVGCIAGAIPIEEYRRGLVEAGFAEVAVVDSGADLNAYAKAGGESCCCAPAATDESHVTADDSPSATGESSAARDELHAAHCGSQPMRGESARSLPVAESSCCGVSGAGESADGEGGDSRALLTRYNVNDYAASVKVFAVKPRHE